MDYPELANLSNLTNIDEVTPSMSMHHIVREIIFTLNCVISILADIAIIYTIFRFRKLRTVTNLFLANWAIADLCSLLVAPNSFRIISIIDYFSLSIELICTLFEIEDLIHVNVCFFVIVTATNWMLEAYFGRWSNIFKKYYKYIIAIPWIVTVINCAVATARCMSGNYYFTITHLFYLGSYLIILLMVVVLQCTRAIQKCKKKPLEYPTLMLTLVSAFTLMCLSSLILALFFNYFLNSLSAVVLYSGSIINFILLYRLYPDFQACFRQAVRCANRYQESLVDPETESKCEVQVSFQAPTEELLSNIY